MGYTPQSPLEAPMASRRIRVFLPVSCLALALTAAFGCASAESPKRPAPAPKAAAPAAPPASPLSTLQFYGSAAGEDGRVVYFLTDGSQMLSVTRGDLVREVYRVEGLADDGSLTLTQVKTQQKQQLPPHVGNDPVARPVPAAGVADDDPDAARRTRRRVRDD
jgi:hypothetical protein